MKPLTESLIRESFVNASRGEISRIPMPGLHEVMWHDREFLGWRDPRSPSRGYIVHWLTDQPIGIALRASEVGLTRGISAMCSLCRSTQPSDQVALFSAPRAGSAGRNGNSVGNYICADLACSILIRIVPPPLPMQPAPDEIVASRVRGLLERVEAFSRNVARPQ